MVTLRYLAWFCLVLLAGTCNAATTIEATSGTFNRLIDPHGYTFDVNQDGRYDATFGALNNPTLDQVLFGVPEKKKNSFRPGIDLVGIHSLPILGNDVFPHTIMVENGNLLEHRYAYSNGIFPAGSPFLTSGIKSHVPEPDVWATILLGIGFVVYQVRPRKALKLSNIASDR